MNVEAQLRALSVVPVVALARADDALPVARALAAGGLPMIEVTFRSDAALAAIERIATGAPDVFLAAGTVISPGQADAAIGAGARLIVTPGFNPAVVDHCLERGTPILPGIATPSELEQALARELTVVKVFPIAALGGVVYLRALGGPYPMMRFAPTGGVGAGQLADYLELPSVAAVGGSWLARPDLVAAGALATIERLAAEAVATARRVRPSAAAALDPSVGAR